MKKQAPAKKTATAPTAPTKPPMVPTATRLRPSEIHADHRENYSRSCGIHYSVKRELPELAGYPAFASDAFSVDRATVDQRAGSFREVGQRTAIVVRQDAEGRFWVTEGFIRHAAACLLDAKGALTSCPNMGDGKINVTIEQRDASDAREALLANSAENVAREDLHGADICALAYAMKQSGLSSETIARSLRCTLSYANKEIRVGSLIDRGHEGREVLRAWRHGEIGFTAVLSRCSEILADQAEEGTPERAKAGKFGIDTAAIEKYIIAVAQIRDSALKDAALASGDEADALTAKAERASRSVFSACLSLMCKVKGKTVPAALDKLGAAERDELMAVYESMRGAADERVADDKPTEPSPCTCHHCVICMGPRKERATDEDRAAHAAHTAEYSAKMAEYSIALQAYAMARATAPAAAYYY